MKKAEKHKEAEEKAEQAADIVKKSIEKAGNDIKAAGDKAEKKQ